MLAKIGDGFLYGLGASFALALTALIFNLIYYILMGLLIQVSGYLGGAVV